jgi:hypothetical protein
MITQEPWFPGFLAGMFSVVVVVVGAVLQNRRERRNRLDETKTPAPPTTQQVWERLDRVERVLGSSIALLSEVADQWQGEHPPVLSKKHVKIVSEAGYLPAEWEPVTDEKE